MYCENSTILKDSHLTHKDNYLKISTLKKFVVLWLALLSPTLINHVKMPVSNMWVPYNPFTNRQYIAILLEGMDSRATTGYTCHSWHSKPDFFFCKRLWSQWTLFDTSNYTQTLSQCMLLLHNISNRTIHSKWTVMQMFQQP